MQYELCTCIMHCFWTGEKCLPCLTLGKDILHRPTLPHPTPLKTQWFAPRNILDYCPFPLLKVSVGPAKNLGPCFVGHYMIVHFALFG